MSVKKSQYLDLFVLILSMSLLSIHSSAGLAGTLFPILKINFSKFNMLIPIIILLIFKIIITIFSPLGQYSTYNFNYIFLIRESFTILLFYTWFIIGLYIYNFTFFISMKWTSVIIVLLLLPIVQVYSSGAPIMATIDASQAIFFLLIFVVFFEKMHSIYLKLLTLGILLSTSFALKSSFTTICGVMLLVIFFVQSTFISRIMVPWRITVVVAIAFLTLASTFADSVNLKDNANSGGNNGETREALAGYALSIFCDFPIFGTPMGRGIIPTGIVEELGWDQYFDPDVAQVVNETYGF
jgi:hypothetical protein